MAQESLNRRRTAWQLWVGVAFSLVFLVLALRDVQFSEVMATLGKVDGGLLALAVASFVVTVLAKAARWRALLALRRTPSLGRAFSILSIGLLVNAFMPARLGELARAYLMGEVEAESKFYVLGTIAIEKILDLVFLVLSVALLLTQMPLPDWLLWPAQVTALAVVAIVPLGLLLAWQNERAQRGLARLGDLVSSVWSRWLVRQAGLGLSSLDVLRRPRLLAELLGWSVFIWALSVATNYLVFAAMGLSLSVWAALLLLVVLQAGVAVPSSPGRIGVFHYLTVLSLALFAVEKEAALGYSVILHLVVYVPMALMGVYCLWHENVTWQKLTEAADRLAQVRGGTG